jgi:enoyl-CoA hydratase
MSGSVRLELLGRVALLTMANESRLNAIDLDLARDLVATATELGRKQIGCVVLRGAGDRAFCSGLDLTSARESGDLRGAVRAVSGKLDNFMAQLAALELPLVAMLRGACFGAGVHLAIHCDFRFGDAGLACGVPALKNGLYYPVAALTRLQELCGAGPVARLLLEGEPAGAQTLLRWGLLDELVPAQDLEQATIAFAQRLAAQPLQGMRNYRAILAAVRQGNLERATALRAAAVAGADRG